MDKQEMYKFIDGNKDMQHIIEKIAKESGRIQIDFNQGKIKRKIEMKRF